MDGIENFDIGQLIGQGGFAKVYRGYDRRNDQEVAIKIISKAQLTDDDLRSRLINEIKLHSDLQHENIAKFISWHEDDQFVYLVLELCRGGNLYQSLKHCGPMVEAHAVAVVRQILNALDYLHQRGIVHRDLKLSNVLVATTDGRLARSSGHAPHLAVKLCDLGFAIRLAHPDDEQYTICGTPNYIAPEVASQQSHGYPADLWSVGIIFYLLVVGQAPFDQQDVHQTLQAIVSGAYDVPAGVFSAVGLDFLRCLLQLEPHSRPNVQQLLRHPLMRGVRSDEPASPSTANASTSYAVAMRRSCDCTASLFLASYPPLCRDAPSSSASSLQSALPAPSRNHLKAATTTETATAGAAMSKGSYMSADGEAETKASVLMPRAFFQEDSTCASSNIVSSQPAQTCAETVFAICDQLQRMPSFLLATPKDALCFHAPSGMLLLHRRVSPHAAPVRLLLHAPTKYLYIGQAGAATLSSFQAMLHSVLGSHGLPSRSRLKYSIELDAWPQLFERAPDMKALRLSELLQVPSMIQTLMQRVQGLVRGVRGRVPQVVVYFPSSSSAPAMKCMLLPGNGPLPSFRIQFGDGTVLRYCLQTGQVFIYKPPASGDAARSVDRSTVCLDSLDGSLGLQWQGQLTSHGQGSDELQHLPQTLLMHIRACQEALEHCLEEYDRLDKRSAFPVVVVSSRHVRMPVR